MAETPRNPRGKEPKMGSEGERPEPAVEYEPQPGTAGAPGAGGPPGSALAGSPRRRAAAGPVEPRRSLKTGYAADVSPDRRVQEQLRTIFRGRVPTEAGDIVSALNRLFPSKQVEGRTDYEYAPQALGTMGELGRGLSATQISVFTRAQAVLTDTKARLELLKPQSVADAENVQAIRLLLLRECSELVDELGRAGGPRVDRVDTLFHIVIGAEGDGNLVARLGDEFGLERDRVQTVEENDNLISYEILRREWQMLLDSWNNFKALEQDDFGVQSGKLFRELKLLGTSVDDVEEALDQADVDVTDREEILVGANDLTLDGLLTWIRHVGQDEGPQTIKEGGRMGVAALIPSLVRLSELLDQVPETELPSEDDLDAAFGALRSHLDESLMLARQIAPDTVESSRAR